MTTLGTDAQVITSKNTSINSSKLPAVYNKVNWDALMSQWYKEHNGLNPLGIVLDYGCGRYTQHIQDFVNRQGFYYLGYDPYWNKIDFMLEIEQLSKINGGGVVAIICSNVLNVIPWWAGVKGVDVILKSLAFSYVNKRLFTTVYEGDKSHIGRETKKDCWQWNRPTESYLFSQYQVIRKGIITFAGNEKFIK